MIPMNNLALLHNIKCIYCNLLSRCCSLVVNKIVGIWTGGVVILRWVWKPKRLLSPILLELLMRNNGESGHEYKPDKHNGLQMYSKEMIIFVANKYSNAIYRTEKILGNKSCCSAAGWIPSCAMATAGSRLFIYAGTFQCTLEFS